MIKIEDLESAETVLDSHFSNTYGGLGLIKATTGEHFLEMGDCMGPCYFGPLSEDEIKAFNLLVKVKELSEIDFSRELFKQKNS